MRSKMYYLWWSCWLVGAALVAASWIDVVTVNTGWVGFGLGMVGFVGSRLRFLNPAEHTPTDFDAPADDPGLDDPSDLRRQ